MELYLVRHAEAQERTENLVDDLRHLTRRGRKQAAKLGRRLKKNRVRPALIITSPLVRAVQTAELLAAELGTNILVTAHAGLSGTADATEVAELLRELPKGEPHKIARPDGDPSTWPAIGPAARAA